MANDSVTAPCRSFKMEVVSDKMRKHWGLLLINDGHLIIETLALTTVNGTGKRIINSVF